jgi:hypothetical protein
MTPSQLLIPRYKVIAPDTSGLFRIGDMLVQAKFNPKYYENVNQPNMPLLSNLENFPHLFQPLHWSAERQESDLPEYVKDEDGKVYKLEYREKQYRIVGDERDMTEWLDIYFGSHISPGTPEEFQTYINKSKMK